MCTRFHNNRSVLVGLGEHSGHLKCVTGSIHCHSARFIVAQIPTCQAAEPPTGLDAGSVAATVQLRGQMDPATAASARGVPAQAAGDTAAGPDPEAVAAAPSPVCLLCLFCCCLPSLFEEPPLLLSFLLLSFFDDDDLDVFDRLERGLSSSRCTSGSRAVRAAPALPRPPAGTYARPSAHSPAPSFQSSQCGCDRAAHHQRQRQPAGRRPRRRPRTRRGRAAAPRAAARPRAPSRSG